MDLNDLVSKLPLVGPSYAKRLAKLNINTIDDLLYHFPFRYDDYSLISDIARVHPGEIVSIKGQITSSTNAYTKTHKQIQKVVLSDSTGSIEAAWFNQPYLTRTLTTGIFVYLSGKVDFFGRKLTLFAPEYELVRNTPALHTGRLVPVYHETAGVSSKWIRSRINLILQTFTSSEFLPAEVVQQNQLLDYTTSLHQIHFPDNLEQAAKARERLSFEELFMLHLTALERKATWHKRQLSHRFKINQKLINKFIKQLPFVLTNAQYKAVNEILADLGKDQPMNRLLEGDVGSGKTIVAACAILTAFDNHTQSVIMTPTEILAEQHYANLSRLFSPFGLKVGLLTGSHKKVASDFDLIIGTHAILFKNNLFDELGLLIIDEQHRLGVEQRSQLLAQNQTPHLLIMTATPIPRTIALTIYSELDLSVLDELPTGRQTIKTWLVPPEKRDSAYQWIAKQISATKSQAFIICPLIEESASETMLSVRAVTTEFTKLKQIFPDFKLALLHGRLKSPEKNLILDKFKNGQIDILVSTPVVEVGIDIPGATIMLIEAAERFGLAQLHQLRGRIGRNDKPAYCLLFSDKHANPTTYKRLKSLETINIGMKLAELDLRLRGSGDLYGSQQHGFVNLKIASFENTPLVKASRLAAEATFENLESHPLLQDQLKKYKILEIKPN